MQVAENPGGSYNPLFLYGGVGLGKTHLIHAVGNGILARKPDAKVRYIHAEQYVSDVVRAYQRKAFDDFKRYYHSLDLLLIDDIQFFAGKARTQEEFFYAFEALVVGRKQIIITCDTYPKELKDMEDRLVSRFASGLTVAIEPPELEMRVAILLKKAESEGVEMKEDVAFFIAKNLRSNVRELEGALRKVIAFSSFHGRVVTVEVAREALKDLLSASTGQVTVELIQKTVADYYKIKVADMYSKRRPNNIALPRQVAMYLAKELTQKSLPEIGELFGGRDHTTVLHAVRKISGERIKARTQSRPARARADAEGLKLETLWKISLDLWTVWTVGREVGPAGRVILSSTRGPQPRARLSTVLRALQVHEAQGLSALSPRVALLISC